MAKGFFEGLLEDFCKSMEIQGAIEASKDENGKIDVAKATGISMGLGNTSLDDMALMGAMLGAEGAFDDEPAEDISDDIAIDPVAASSSGIYSSPFEDTLIGINLVSADDMELLNDAGYDETDLELMSSEELRDAMDEAGVDTDLYDFD